MDKTILIAGGTGLIGTMLCKKLADEGYTVHLLSRKPSKIYPFTLWAPEKDYYDENTIPEADIMINLAGAGIADKRWTAERKKVIVESRVSANRVLQQILTKQKNKASLFLSASAIGIYGDRDHELLDEKSKPGDNGFLLETVKSWEAAVNSIHSDNLRKVIFRIGVVLSMKGGALPQMVNPMKFCIAPYFGSGQQIYSWVHIEDLCNMFLYAIHNKEMNGVYNAVSPGPVSNKQMIETIIEAKHRTGLIIPIPVFIMRILLGEMADVILHSSNVSPERLISIGFKYKYPDLLLALKDIFENNK